MRKIFPAFVLAALILSGCQKEAPDEAQISNTVSSTERPASSSGTLEKYMITCAEITYRTIYDSDEKLPPVMEVTDDIMLSEVLGYDMSITEDFSVYIQLVSSDLFELTVIRADSDNLPEVKEMLEKRQTYLRDQAAYYPSQVKAAGSSVTGELNGYCYLICSENADALEKHILYHILHN